VDEWRAQLELANNPNELQVGDAAPTGQSRSRSYDQ
jgi:hypothetical protein